MKGGRLGLKNPRDEFETGRGLDLRDMLDGFSNYTQSGPPKRKGGWRKTLFFILAFVCTVMALLLVVDHCLDYRFDGAAVCRQ